MNNLNKYVLLAMAAVMTACGGGDDDQWGGQGGGGSETKNVNRNVVTTHAEVLRLEFPKVKGGKSVILVHQTTDSYGVNYAVEWDTELKSQRWSCYQMRSGYGGNAGRYDPEKNPGAHKGELQYPFDPQLSRDLYLDRDYFYGSGFDHGHICPSADRQYSKEANYQTFFLTNMQPQYNAFNAYLWADMEEKVRNLTPKNLTDTLYVCKGGTIDQESDIIKRVGGKLIVPKYFYMALLLKTQQGYRAIALWATNEKKKIDGTYLAQYAISIDELEKKTGIDFFCNLPDKIEDRVEASCSPTVWGLR